MRRLPLSARTNRGPYYITFFNLTEKGGESEDWRRATLHAPDQPGQTHCASW